MRNSFLLAVALASLLTACGDRPAPAVVCDRPKLDKASQFYRKAEAAIANADYAQGLHLAKSGIATLGYPFWVDSDTRVMLDDSGLHLVLAESEEREGRTENAARGQATVLGGRLSTYSSDHNCGR